MHNKDHKSFVDGYSTKLTDMDKESSKWRPHIKAKYEHLKEGFQKNLDRWQDIADDKWDNFKVSTENTWVGFEREWNDFKSTSN